MLLSFVVCTKINMHATVVFPTNGESWTPFSCFLAGEFLSNPCIQVLHPSLQPLYFYWEHSNCTQVTLFHWISKKRFNAFERKVLTLNSLNILEKRNNVQVWILSLICNDDCKKYSYFTKGIFQVVVYK